MLASMARSRALRLSATERRRQIVESAREVFLTQGIAGAGTRQLAEAAGINSALLYHYFETKEAIFEAAVLEPLREMIADIFDVGLRLPQEDVAARVDDVERGVARMVRKIKEALPLLGIVLFSEEEMGRRFYEDHIHPLLDQAFEAGRPGLAGWADAPVYPWMMTAIWGCCLGMAMDHHFRGIEIDEDELAHTLGSFVLRGLPVPDASASVGAAENGRTGVSPRKRKAATRKTT